MKKILISSFAALALLTGCANTTTQNEAPVMKVENVEVIEFQADQDQNYKATLKSSDMFNTAMFMDSKGNKYNLKAMPAGSGTMLGNDEGVSVHFSKGEGIITLGKGQKDIFVSYDEKSM
ncbi:hypothetical protein CBLAS_0744 [Campylobacter blaseri]|uniref:Hydrogenase 4 subunit B n=1 Tax=Campylobacter blaseri TaxID=2042961 RepID=A0A2P8R2A5_9BACT|nr:hydrogenase 4 subunit B [Campylobacter blaseri]PSM52634.1 hydrogenase 4 subunit B [Campylobacter blaseri]PSM54282.1 hydrogenase 4 subunit B [Campylobacter blaseri]QKF85933.1 hypothetical protein CBLAS_0744 [Campylobacter blaseri]